MILLARRDAPAGQDHVEGGRGIAQDGLHALRVVRQGRPRHRGVAQLAQARHQQVAIGVIDLARAQRHARLNQLVACGEHRHGGPREHGKLGATDGRRQPDPRGGEHAAGPQHDLSRTHVLACPAHEAAGRGHRIEVDDAVLLAGQLAHQDRVGAGRQRRARGDAHAFAFAQRRGIGTPGELLAGQAQAATAGIGMAQGKTIHRAVVERRQVDPGHHIRRQHASIGARGGELLDRHAPLRRQLAQQRLGIVHGKTAGIGGHQRGRGHLPLTCRSRRRLRAICRSVNSFFLPSYGLAPSRKMKRTGVPTSLKRLRKKFSR